MEEIQENEAMLQADKELQNIPLIDEVKKSLIEKYSLDEDVDADLIEKLANDTLESRKSMSTVIKQKIAWREKAKAQTEQKPVENPQTVQNPAETSNINELVDKRVEEKLEENTLASSNVSDEIKTEVKNYAKANGVSISQALKSPYVSFLQEEEKKKQKIEKASLGNNHRAPINSSDLSSMKPTDFDMTSKEGREDYAKWRELKKSS